MADQRINELIADPANANVARDDLVLIQRGGVDRPARLAGTLLLPAYNPVSDRGKNLQIDSAGNVAWALPTTTNYTRLLTQVSPTSPVSLSADLTGYKDIRLVFQVSGDDDGVRIVELPAGVPRGYSADAKIQAWLTGSSTINYQFYTPDPGDFAAAQNLQVYARR